MGGPRHASRDTTTMTRPTWQRSRFVETADLRSSDKNVHDSTTDPGKTKPKSFIGAKEVTKDTRHPEQEENMQKENAAGEKEVRKLRDEVKQKEFGTLSSVRKARENKMADAHMAEELQGVHGGEETSGSNASQTGDSCLEAL